jgi:hypothetical protein
MIRLSRSFRLLLALPALLLLGGAAEPAGVADGSLTLTANLTTKTLTVTRGDGLVKSYVVSDGKDAHPTPGGTFAIRKIVWNPAWVPPDAKWAKGKQAKQPGHPDNPMKLVKLFFREPDYYIHGTEAVESLGQAASHGCLRMDPDEAGEVALMIMENAGVARDWDWVKGLLHMGETRVVTLKLPAPLTIVR